VWSFMSLMMEYLKSQAILISQEEMGRGVLHRQESMPPVVTTQNVKLADVYTLLQREDPAPHMWGLSKLLPLLGYAEGWAMGEEFLDKCRLGVLQFVPVQALATVATVVCEWRYTYHEGRWSWGAGYAYVTPVRAISQGVALYCLVYFYHGTEKLLRPIDPLAKFLSIKLVIFFTFWQSVILPFLSQEHLPIIGDRTLHLLWSYLFTYKYNNYDYSHNDDHADFDHGNTAVWIFSKNTLSCDCAEGWDFGNRTWFTPGAVSINDPLLDDNPGACCNYLVDPDCGAAPFGQSLWCPVNLTSCKFKDGELDPDHSRAKKYLEPLQPEETDSGDWNDPSKQHRLHPSVEGLLASGFTSWSFCTSSFGDPLTMDEESDEIPSGHNVTFDELCVRGSQAVLVCIEMFLASLAHKNSKFFGYKRFKAKAVMGFGDALAEMLKPTDVVADVQDGLQEIGAGVIEGAAETLYSLPGGTLAADGVETIRRAADGTLGAAGQLANDTLGAAGQLATGGLGSIRNLTGLLGGESPRRALEQQQQQQQETERGADAAEADSSGADAAGLGRTFTTDLMAQADSRFGGSSDGVAE
jgi:hypothetical protein